MSPSDIIAHFIDKPLDFQPGEKWNYSNSGYIVLGTIIEQVSGMTYGAFLKEIIFDPLKMVNTGYLENTEPLAVGYNNATDTSPANFEDLSGLYAAGGLYSTIGDLYLWDRALSTDKLIPRNLRVKMFTSYASMPESGGFGYGYGWMIGEIANRRVVAHPGRIEGFTGGNFYFPDDEIVVIVLSNQWNVAAYNLGVQLAKMILEAK